jgi:mannose-6-phosphate isomerase-like protein (cupin superfamily)
MICRHPSQGQTLDVAGLNQIIVLIDRSETELTEVGINSWHPGLDGPPHAHTAKEQNFLITAGRGEVVIGGESFPATPGDLFYVPAGVVHQTINRGADRLTYFLFNAFLDASKEGHASFADHINKVKETRRQQAEQQRAEADADLTSRPAPVRRGKRIALPTTGGAGVVLLARTETQQCEALAWQLAGVEPAVIAADPAKEQTLFVVAGTGSIQVGHEPAAVRQGHTLLVPRGTACALTAGPTGMQVVSFGTIVVH